MPRATPPIRTPLAAVAAWLGLPQRTLGLYLNVSTGYAAHLHTGRRDPAPTTWSRLERLLALLPPPWGTGPPDPAPSPPALPLPVVAPVAAPPPAALTPPATARALGRAHRLAAQTAANLRAQLQAGHARAATVARQRAAVAALDVPDPTDPDPARTARLVAALRLEIAIGTGPGSASDPAALAHATLRLWLLETEVAALAGWLREASAE